MPERIHNETDLIQTYLAPLAAGYPGALGLTDDAAFISPPAGSDLVISTDPIVEGVHFPKGADAADTAWKALAVNISDLVAKGAEPLAYTMALALPEAPERAWMARFAEGLGEAQRAFGCHLIGGDTDRTSGPLSIAITAIGAVPSGRMVRRTTAKIGDQIFVTGTLGDAALGLEVLRNAKGLERAVSRDEAAYLLDRYRRPRPRTEIVSLLREVASGSLDLSDGLVKDLGRLAAAAGASATLRFADVPLSPAAGRLASVLKTFENLIVASGDDYEVLFTVAPENMTRLQQLTRTCPVAVTRIGELQAGDGVVIVAADGRKLAIDRPGFDHFG